MSPRGAQGEVGIPVVCKRCGREDAIVEFGDIEIRAEVWRTTRLGWNPATNRLTSITGQLESDRSLDLYDIELEDEARMRGFACECGAESRDPTELVAPKYGVDRLGRVLDEYGIAHGPPRVHEHQLELRLAA